MRKKWEYGIVHIDAKTGFLLADMFKTPMSMEEVRELATEGTGIVKERMPKANGCG